MMNDTGSNQTLYWEKPWSTDELRQNSGNWSLAGDSGLLNGLESMSQKILTQTEGVLKEVDSLVQDSKATGSQIYNAINDFLMLSNTQFVENRVYDEEIQEELINADKKTHVEKQSKEEREAELVPRIREAVQLGLNVVETAFEKHQVSDSESDEEHEDRNFHTLPLLKPKDIYIDRPLPYIIGSDKFMQDDCAGLGELYSDEEDIDDSDKEELSKENNVTTDLEESETEEDTDMKHIKALDESRKDDSEEGGDLFAPSEDEFGYDGEEDDADVSSTKSETQTLNNTADFAAELAAKLGASQRNRIDEDHVTHSTPQDVSRNKRKESKRERRSSKLSSRGGDVAVVDLSDDESSPFGQATKRFSSSGGLFDDADEENDLFAESNARKDSKVNVTKASRNSSVSLFEDDNNDLFVTPRMEAGSDSTVAQSSSRSTKPSLFNETDDDEDLFSSVGPLSKKKSVTDKTSSLFDDADATSDDLHSEPRTAERSSSESSPRKKLPPGAVSIFGGATSSMAEALKARRTMSDSDKEGEDWLGSGKGSQRSVSKVSSSSTVSTDEKMIASSAKNTVNKEAEKEKPKEDLFNVGEKTTKVVPRKISLFDDDDDDDEDLFAEPTITKRSREKIEEKPQVGEIKPREDEVKPSEKVVPPTSSKTVSSLFDDDDDDGVDLFKTDIKPKEGNTLSSKLRTHSLFDEEDALFGGPSEEAPSVDLFKVPDVDTNKTKPPTSLFDKSDDNLFNSKPNDSKGKPPIPTPRKASLPRDEPLNTTTGNPTATGSPKKKPIGGVSLFGGLDPFADKLKRSSDIVKKDETPASEKSPESSPKSLSAVLSMNVIPLPDESPTVNLDEPAEARTLHTVGKGRVKIQTKRRLPSRKARLAATQRDVFGDDRTVSAGKITEKLKIDIEGSDTEKTTEKETEREQEIEKEKEMEKDVENESDQIVMSPSTEEEDLLPVDELISAKLTPTIISQDVYTREKEPTKSKPKLDSDLFDDLNGGDDDLFATRTKKSSLSEDDIFSSASKAKSTIKILNSDDDDDLDDLFATPKVHNKILESKKVEPKKEAKKISLFDTESDSDDIFADLEPKKNPTIKSKSALPTMKTSKETKKSLFDDDDDDNDNLFNDPLMVKSNK